MHPTALYSIILLSCLVQAKLAVRVRSSPVTLSLSRRVNATGIHDLLQHDIGRANALRAHAKAGSQFHEARAVAANQPLDNIAILYIASVGVGSPATNYDLIVDTGSANTWIGSGKSYIRTSTSVQTHNNVSVKFGTGSFSGVEFTDTITLGDLVLPEQSIGVATEFTGFPKFIDGILGIGRVGLTVGTLSPDTTSLIPTVTDNLFSKGLIKANEIGISFVPATSFEAVNGELTWGGVDTSKFIGSINYAPLTTTPLAGKFWGIDQSIRYGQSTPILSNTAGIVDTGTTLTLLASDAFARYQQATGAVVDTKTGLLRITKAQLDQLQSLFFTINDVTYEFTANAQLWPRSLNAAIGGTDDNIYLIFADLKSNTGSGFDFVNGLSYLERFYTVFDSANDRVGFAETPFTTATTN